MYTLNVYIILQQLYTLQHNKEKTDKNKTINTT